MKLRKINAVFSLLSTILLMIHAIYFAVWMLSNCSIPMPPTPMSRALTVSFVIHAIISIVLMISTHKGSKNNKGKQYVKLNFATIVQRISGVFIIVFTTLHILGAFRVMRLPYRVHFIVYPLFFTLVLVHVAISTSKAFITLGIGNARVIKRIDVAIKVLCGATLIADVIGFFICAR